MEETFYMNGEIEIYHGCMFSMRQAELLLELVTAEIENLKKLDLESLSEARKNNIQKREYDCRLLQIASKTIFEKGIGAIKFHSGFKVVEDDNYGTVLCPVGRDEQG